jgi:hypothetical protein
MTRISKFGRKGEKTGWTYIDIPGPVAQSLFPGNRKSFRVKGLLDDHPVEGIALMPMGDGSFIMPLNAGLRGKICKKEGDMLKARLMHDSRIISYNKELMLCLEQDPEANEFFNELPGSHRRYFSNWVEDAKTEDTRARRIAKILKALSLKMNYGEMIRAKF